MGDVKDKLTPDAGASKKKGGVLGALSGLGNRNRDDEAEKLPPEEKFIRTLANLVIEIGPMIGKKESDFKSERGKEFANAKKVALLKTMEHHLRSAVDCAHDYLEV